MLLFVVFAVYRFTFFLPNTSCIADAYHNFTITLNRDLVTEAGPAFEGNSNQLSPFGRAFIGMGQILMDLWIAIMAVVWYLPTHAGFSRRTTCAPWPASPSSTSSAEPSFS
jgi:hypothetical protein